MQSNHMASMVPAGWFQVCTVFLPTMRNFHICIFKLLKDLLIYNIVNSSIQNTIDFNVTEYGSIFNN